MMQDGHRNCFGKAMNEVISWTGRDIDRLGRGAESGERVAGLFVIMRKWHEVIECWMMWHGCVDKNSVGGV
jgi:hypothetical protein